MSTGLMAALVAAGIAWSLLVLYFAVRSRDFRKFLAGAFFVSAGTQFYMANVPVPLIGTDMVQTPEISATRGVVHSILFLLTFYFGFLHRPRA
jgi:hypothetical protein